MKKWAVVEPRKKKIHANVNAKERIVNANNVNVDVRQLVLIVKIVNVNVIKYVHNVIGLLKESCPQLNLLLNQQKSNPDLIGKM